MRVYITGIVPFDLNSNKSGFNIATNLTFNKKYAQLCGIEKESAEEAVRLLKYDGDKEQLMKIIIENYGGYCFHSDQQNDLIHPTLLLYFLDKVQSDEEIPRKLNDNNVSFSKVIIFALKNQEFAKHLGDYYFMKT